MRPSIWYRALVGIWGLWFTAALSDAPGVHTCAMHGGHSAVANQAQQGSHAGHGATGGAPGHDSKSNACTCLAACCCTPSIAAPAQRVAIVAAPVVDQAPAQYLEPSAPVVRRAYSLPFANGPPTAPVL